VLVLVLAIECQVNEMSKKNDQFMRLKKKIDQLMRQRREAWR
jgi:hypothetical protein